VSTVKTSGPKPVKALVSDVTGVRALDVEYQNTTGRPKLCLITILCVGGAALEEAYVIKNTKATSPANVSRGRVGYMDVLGGERCYFEVVMAVPPGWYYKLTKVQTGTSTVSMYKWTEVEL